MFTLLADFLVVLRERSPELAALVEAWPKLPEHVRATILTLVSTVVMK